MKPETLEEAAETFTKNTRLKNPISLFCEGAKWQAERMYSHEEVVAILEHVRKNYYDTGSKWHQEPSTDYTSEELLNHYINYKTFILP